MTPIANLIAAITSNTATSAIRLTAQDWDALRAALMGATTPSEGMAQMFAALQRMEAGVYVPPMPKDGRIAEFYGLPIYEAETSALVLQDGSTTPLNF